MFIVMLLLLDLQMLLLLALQMVVVCVIKRRLYREHRQQVVHYLILVWLKHQLTRGVAHHLVNQ